mmetsp:Transcript_11384/g.27348  ORF Transcript_11384/g.27348 Transcript_11384/m.27348 type:complete len:114 (-) Transcript_11384:313-654(-)
MLVRLVLAFTLLSIATTITAFQVPVGAVLRGTSTRHSSFPLMASAGSGQKHTTDKAPGTDCRYPPHEPCEASGRCRVDGQRCSIRYMNTKAQDQDAYKQVAYLIGDDTQTATK